MISEKENTRISKFLSLVLRHQPESIGIALDKNGWTNVKTLIEKSSSKGLNITEEILRHIVETNEKRRFVFNDTFDKIRANQGHSVEIDLGYVAQHPPAILYHGTSEKSVDSILKTGLQKRDRHHVHLSDKIETAIQVGKRYGKPIVFIVLAEKMFVNKHEFFQSDNGVWLTDNVPEKYLKKLDE